MGATATYWCLKTMGKAGAPTITTCIAPSARKGDPAGRAARLEWLVDCEHQRPESHGDECAMMGHRTPDEVGKWLRCA
jgi:hypothetical protein